jgi:signal transduction histidine kinase
MITNAVQAIPDRYKLTITASKLMGDVLIKIEDTDVGIPEENLAKFF